MTDMHPLLNDICYLRTLPILAINCTAPVLTPDTLVLAPLLQEQKRSLLSTYTAKKQVLAVLPETGETEGSRGERICSVPALGLRL